MELKEIQTILEANTEGGARDLRPAAASVFDLGGLSFDGTRKLIRRLAWRAADCREKKTGKAKFAISQS